jgi:para-aminobenzoate synthetase component I
MNPLRATALWRPLALGASPASVIDALLAQAAEPAVLESSAPDAQIGRYTLLGCQPIEVIELRDGTLAGRGGTVLCRGDDSRLWQALRAAFACVRLDEESAAPGGRPAYCPGWIGYAGYELGRHVERLPSRAVRDTALPDLRFALYDALLVHDALEARWWLTELLFEDLLPGAGQAAAALCALGAAARGVPESPTATALAAPGVELTPPAAFVSNFIPQEYERAVARCIEYIHAGDIFQVNLSQRFTVAGAPPSRHIYRALRQRNPAPYAAYLAFEADGRECAVASSSPELFLSLRGDRVLTRPIKGTRPRVGDSRLDDAARAALWASEKDNAELAMIVDVLRNDLGRVCRIGSVRVTEPRRLEAYASVFHLVATVEGRLCAGNGPAELLRAAFPGGSITGAPKIRAMQIIDELEPVARGVYTGAIGIVGADGSAELNVAIRTVVCDGSTAHVQAGGGIVAESTPAAELEETLVKARALLEAIEQARQQEPD